MSPNPSGCPAPVADYAAQAVEYVKRALGLELSFDSETLPVLDHWVSQVPRDQPAMRALVAATAGAYFGEVVRRALGGSWIVPAGAEPPDWRLELPGGLSFSPAGFAAAAIARDDDVDDHDTTFEAPPRMRPVVEALLDKMAPLTEAEYYSLSGRFDTICHVHESLLSFALAAASRDSSGSSTSN